MKDRQFVINCNNSHRIDFKFSHCEIETTFEQDDEGNVLGEMVFGDYPIACMSIIFSAIDNVIKMIDGVYLLELKDGKSNIIISELCQYIECQLCQLCEDSKLTM